MSAEGAKVWDKHFPPQSLRQKDRENIASNNSISSDTCLRYLFILSDRPSCAYHMHFTVNGQSVEMLSPTGFGTMTSAESW